MTRLPDTLCVLLARFGSMDRNTASESTIVGLPDLAGSSKFLPPKRNFLNYLVTVLRSTSPSSFRVSSWLGQQNIPTASLKMSKTPIPTSVLDTTLKKSNGEVLVMLEFWGNVEYPFIALAPRSTLDLSGYTWRGPMNGTFWPLNYVQTNDLC